MKKNKQQHQIQHQSTGGAPSVSSAIGPSGINLNNILVNNTGAMNVNSFPNNGPPVGNILAAPQIAGGIIMSQSSSTTNAATSIANSINASQTKAPGGSSSVSSAAKKRNTTVGVPQAGISGSNQGDLLNKQPHPLGQQKKVNNFVIDSQAYSSVQQQPQPLSKNPKQYQSACHSTKSSQGGPNHHQKTHSSGATTTKHSAIKGGSGGPHGNWKFVERRLSAKVLHQQEAGGGSTSNSVGPSKKVQQNVNPMHVATAAAALGGGKNSIQYENLMLQQLLKQQHKLDEKQALASGISSGAFKKNLSVISIDHNPNQASSNPLVPSGPTLGAPQMMLNISYNMNNNIDANSAAQFVFHQHPPQAPNTSGMVAAVQNAPINAANDPLQQVLAAAQQHHPLTNQQQQQIRTIIGLATAAQGDLPLSMSGNGTLGPNASASSGLMTGDHHLPQNQQTAATTHPLMDQIPSQAQYKTQVDTKKAKQLLNANPISNPYHTNASSSMLGEGMMTYENSIVQAVKHAELKYREQSFDQIKRKRRSVNAVGGGVGANHQNLGGRSKQQLSSNSGRRGTIGASHKAISQQATQHPNSRSTSSKRKGDGKGSQTNNQQNFRGESSRGLLSSGQMPNNASAQQYHQSKKSVQKRSIEQAKLKVKGSFSQPPELQNHRSISGHQAAATAPAQSGLLFPHPHPSTHVLTPGAQASANTDKDRYLLYKLDEALESDLKDKPSSQRVSICSKVWSEIIRRQDPVIASLLSKIKSNYESHIKNQAKQNGSKNQTNNGPKDNSQSESKEQLLEKELASEREARKCAEEKVENLSGEVQQLMIQCKKQEDVMAEMKKQILAYRREIIDLSSNKKAYSLGGHSNHHHNSKSEGRRVPRLDLSKLHRDSENVDEKEEQESCVSIQDPLLEDENGKNVTYQQYLKFLENENRFPDPNLPPGIVPQNFQQLYNNQNGADQLPPPDQLAEESQESLMRQEELKQRKNKIIQLLNGDISEDGDGNYEEEEEEEQSANQDEEEYVVDDDEDQPQFVGEETEIFQQVMNIGQFTAEINDDIGEDSQLFENFNKVQPQNFGGGVQVTEEERSNEGNMQEPDEEAHQIDIVAAAKAAKKAREITANKYQMIDKKQGGALGPKGAQKNFQFEVHPHTKEKNLLQDFLDEQEYHARQEDVIDDEIDNILL